MAGSLYQACTKFAEMAAPEEDSFATVVALQPSYLTRTNGTTIETVDSFKPLKLEHKPGCECMLMPKLQTDCQWAPGGLGSATGTLIECMLAACLLCAIHAVQPLLSAISEKLHMELRATEKQLCWVSTQVCRTCTTRAQVLQSF